MDRVYAGIDLGGTNIKYGLCNSQGKVIVHRQTPSAVTEGPESLMMRIGDCAEKLLRYVSENKYVVSHLGVGTPGVVDVATGRIAGGSPNIPGWEGNNPRDYLESRLGLPVHVDNDVNVAALAESLFGAAKGYRNVIAITVGTGIGSGILIEGKLYRGTVGGAGELGHMTIVKDGRECSCGRRGCLEAYAATPYLVEIAESLAADSRTDSSLASAFGKNGALTVKDIFEAFESRKDPVADRAVELHADYLACGLSSALAILAPDIVVVGGGVSDAGGGLYVRLIRRLLKQQAAKWPVGSTRLVKARLGNRAGFIGAAILGDNI